MNTQISRTIFTLSLVAVLALYTSEIRAGEPDRAMRKLPEKAKHDIKAADDMCEVLFQHFFWNNGSGMRGPTPLPDYWDIYISVDKTVYKNQGEWVGKLLLGLEGLKPPTDEFMKRFKNNKRRIVAVPKGATGMWMITEHHTKHYEKKKTKQMPIIFMIDGTIKNKDGSITVMAAYHAHSLNSGTYVYVMKLKNGKWIVDDAKCTGCS